MIFDASVVRNVALLDCLDLLAVIAQTKLRIVHGVLAPKGELSDLGGIRDAFEREYMKENAGSARYNLYLVGASNLERLRDGQFDAELLQPSDDAVVEAIRLHEADAAMRAQLGIRKRRLALSDCLTIAVALELEEPVATDDSDAARAYLRLGGVEHWWTLDILRRAVNEGHLNRDVAMRGYDMLLDSGFYGIEADDL